jgi:hypothetical protein
VTELFPVISIHSYSFMWTKCEQNELILCFKGVFLNCMFYVASNGVIVNHNVSCYELRVHRHRSRGLSRDTLNAGQEYHQLQTYVTYEDINKQKDKKRER